jgi:hypothetical protein
MRKLNQLLTINKRIQIISKNRAMSSKIMSNSNIKLKDILMDYRDRQLRHKVI